MNSLRNFRLVKLDSIWQSLVWSYRICRLDFPFPRTLRDWHKGDFDPYRIALLYRAWEFLRPFFASRGYTLYKKVPNSADSVPLPTPVPAPSDLDVYPYARRISPEDPPELSLSCEYIWGARDELGREVVLKLVSQRDQPSNEWKILQRVNEAKLRSDPRNHAISVIEFLYFDNFVFAVMPRWDIAMVPDFSVVSELLEYSKAWLEVMDFLHEHRIAHQDLTDGNLGMNFYGTYDQVRFRKGLRNPGEVRYAVYDFGHSLLYEEGVDIYSVKTERFIRFHYGNSPEGPYNPFKADVAMLGGLLECRVRHIENTVPSLGPFFEWMRDEDEEKRPTARQALQRFLEIYGSLTQEQLNAKVTGSRWKDGKVIPKEREG